MVLTQSSPLGKKSATPGSCYLYGSFADMTSIVTDILPFNRDRALRVLELGGAYGIFGPRIAKRYPEALLAVTDTTPSLRNDAIKHFEEEALPRISFRLLAPATDTIKGVYDLILCSFGLHTLEPERQARFCKGVLDSLEPGGIFICCERFCGENPLAEKLYRRGLTQRMQKMDQIDPIVLRLFETIEAPHPLTFAQQKRMLDDIGFSEVTTWYQYLGFGLVSATKPL